MKSGISLLFFMFVFTASLGLSASSLLDQPSQSLIVKMPVDEGKKEITITITEFPDVSPEQFEGILSDNRTKNLNAVVAIDDPKYLEAALKSHKKVKSNRLMRLIPLGKLSPVKESLSKKYNLYKKNVAENYKIDKVGLTFMMVSFGIEQFVLYHATGYSSNEKISLALANTLILAVFSLDRDMFNRLISPTKDRMIKTLDRFILPKKYMKTKTILSQYISSFGMTFMLNSVRLGSLSIDGIDTALTTENVMQKTLLAPTLSTVSGFSWAEVNYQARQKGNQARLLLRRLSDFRSVLMASFASLPVVLNAHLTDAPVLAYGVNATLGLIVLINSEKIINFLNNSPKAQFIFKINQSLERFLTVLFNKTKQTAVLPVNVFKKKKNPKKIIYTCQGLFTT